MKSWMIGFVAVVVAAFLLRQAPVKGADPKGRPPAPAALTVLQGYLLNRDAFPFATCRFKIAESEAKSEEAALRGEYSAATLVQEGVWVRHGRKERFRVACDPAILARIRKGDRSVSLSIVVDDYLSDGTYAVRGAEEAGIANFALPGGRRVKPSDNPFNWFGNNYDQWLTTLLAQSASAKVNGWVTWEDRELVSLTYRKTNYPREDKACFDPKQGYLPIVERSRGEEMEAITYLTRVKALPGERWFPERWVFIQHFMPIHEFRVRTLEVVSLDVTTPPPDSAFDFPLDGYVQLVDTDRASSAYHPEQGERIEVGKMRAVADKLNAMVDARSQRAHADGPGADADAQSPSQQPARHWWLIGNVVIALILIGGGLARVLWRRRHRSPQP
jgi:hypothetical protein